MRLLLLAVSRPSAGVVERYDVSPAMRIGEAGGGDARKRFPARCGRWSHGYLCRREHNLVRDARRRCASRTGARRSLLPAEGEVADANRLPMAGASRGVEPGGHGVFELGARPNVVDGVVLVAGQAVRV